MFDKHLWSSIVRFRSIDAYPLLPCPHCNASSLQLDRTTLQFREVPLESFGRLQDKSGSFGIADVKDMFEANKFLGVLAGIGKVAELANQHWTKFVGFFTCGSCGKSVSAVGSAISQKNRAGSTSIKIEYFSPVVPMFHFSETTPQSINNELLQAFSHFHADLTASGGKLRRAIEQYCIELGYTDRLLHKRISDMKAVYPNEAEWLQSLKLVGNEATHGRDIEESDLLHAFEVFEILLDVFRRRMLESNAQKAVAQLNAKFQKNP